VRLNFCYGIELQPFDGRCTPVMINRDAPPIPKRHPSGSYRCFESIG
jgi:hypothetical protein